MLLGWLEFYRATIARKCAGLDPEDLRCRAVPPSSLSLLGLVRHLAEVERHWIRGTWAGDRPPALYCSKAAPDADFAQVDDADAEAALAAWHAECAHARQVLSGPLDLDEATDRRWRGEAITRRWILVHLVEEYARHAGHADLLREAIDGQTGI
jgi:uncharacterized damage-inducible protein DinB